MTVSSTVSSRNLDVEVGGALSLNAVTQDARVLPSRRIRLPCTLRTTGAPSCKTAAAIRA
jgi:hypothetical protein